MKRTLKSFSSISIILIVLVFLGCSKSSDPSSTAPVTTPAATSTAPTLTTSAASSTTATSAIVGGAISSQGSDPVTARGVCYAASTGPKISDSATGDGAGTGVFQSNLTDLRPNTIYYARAYAINSKGTAYGNEITFTTMSLISTNSITNIRLASAVSGGSIINDGGASITEKGICYSTSPSPTSSSNKISAGAGKANFTSNINGLTANTKYYVRSYAISNGFTSYGDEINFTATPGIGDTYQGGLVLYLLKAGDIGYDPNILHGIILATGTVATSYFGKTLFTPFYAAGVPWGPSVLVGTNTVIGSGKTNTDKIIAAGGPTTSAVRFCDNLVLNGFSDWYLPSRDELQVMMPNNAALANPEPGFYFTTNPNDACVSSSEVNQTTFYCPRGGALQGIFNEPKDGNKNSGETRTVRAVRSF